MTHSPFADGASVGRSDDASDDVAFFGVDEANAVVEAVVWITAAAASGAIGNSADRWIRKVVRRRHRWRLVRLPELSQEGAVEIARRALELDGRLGAQVVEESYAAKDALDRWVVRLHLATGKVYTVRIPRRGHRANAVRVHLSESRAQ